MKVQFRNISFYPHLALWIFIIIIIIYTYALHFCHFELFQDFLSLHVPLFFSFFNICRLLSLIRRELYAFVIIIIVTVNEKSEIAADPQ